MTAVDRVEQFLTDVESLDDPAVFISVAESATLLAAANELDHRPADELPLRGLIFGVKDNIDVVGMPTTAGCPAFSFDPETSAPVVQRLVDAGALPVAKTNLDQFATGVVGTRSPYGIPRNPFDPEHVPGGSSSGSAVAVARDLVDFALGTDTAGSGRVPAAFCGVIGLKPTIGRLPTLGVVPAVRTLDCVSIFADDLATAGLVLASASGFEPDDPYSRSAEPGPATGAEIRFGVLDAASLRTAGASERAIAAYLSTIEHLPPGPRSAVDFTPFAEAGDLLYGGPWVAERTQAVGAFIAEHPDEVDPTVGQIISAGAAYTAVDAYAAADRLARLRRRIDLIMAEIDVLVFPTTPHGATLSQVAADPVGANSRLGRFTTFANLVDLAGLSVPAIESAADGRVPQGVSLYTKAWGDELLLSVAGKLLAQPLPPSLAPSLASTELIPLVVAGAHLKGQPLEWQLTELGAVWQETTRTAASYRLFALPGGPPKKPGVVFDPDGASLEVDVWAVTAAALGRFLTMVPAPLALGTVTLRDGRELTGFVCEPRAMEGAIEITDLGGWRNYEPAPAEG